MTTIKFFDTYSILAQYNPERHEVEISEHLKKYPELFAFLLLHELTHASFGKHSLKHFSLDIKDRFRFFADNQLQEQWSHYRKDARFGFKRTWKDTAFIISYNLLSEFSIFIYLAGDLVRFLKKRKRIETMDKHYMETIKK